MKLNWTEFNELCDVLGEKIEASFGGTLQGKRIYGVPTGGSFVALNLANSFKAKLVDSFEVCDILVDDIVDSGKTISQIKLFSKAKKYALFVREGKESLVDGYVGVLPSQKDWVEFPYEKAYGGEEIITRLLQFLGEDVDREGLRDTPKRVLSFLESYKATGDRLEGLTFFENKEHYDQMIVVSNLDFYSFCEHHLLPFFGKVHIGYIPTPEGKLLGLSKFGRVVDFFSKRLQLQERMTQQIADFLTEKLCCLGLGVVVEATHLCMAMRGIKQQRHITVTSAVKGVFLDDTKKAREEFFKAIGRSL